MKRANMVPEVIHGDALEVLRGMDDDSVDAVVTDPPYSSGGQFRGDRQKAVEKKYGIEGGDNFIPFSGDARDARSYFLWCTLWLAEAFRVVRAGGVISVFTDWRQLPAVSDALQVADFTWRGVAVWDKVVSRPQKGRYKQQAEFVCWGSKGAMPSDRGVPPLPGLWSFSPRSSEKLHMTGKPVGVMREIVKIAPPNGIILDPFAGSGTTGIAAMREGFRSVLIEREPEYVDIIHERIRLECGRPSQSHGPTPDPCGQPSLFG